MKNILVDAHLIPSAEQFDYIAKMFDSLESNDTLTISHDQDITSLMRQFSDTLSAQFKAEILEKGPKIWKVKLTKKMKEGCCGCC